MTEATTDINELFSRDPLKLTNEDIKKIVEVYREKRKLFNANPAAVKSRKAPPKQAEKLKGLDLSNIKLDL